MGENLKQAFKEVFSLTPDEGKTQENTGKNLKTNQKESIQVKQSTADSGKFENENRNAFAISTNDEQEPVQSNLEPARTQKNIIARGTKILGSIITESDIDINGQVEGDVESKGRINVTGNIIGKITCSDAEIDRAVIEGDINVSGELSIGEGSKIHGTVSAKSIHVSGEVKGDVLGSADVKITNVANVQGNITTPAVTVESGAILNGKMDIQR